MTINPFVKIIDVRVRLDVKIQRDEGEGTVVVAADGAVVTFNKTFIDVRSISITPAYNASYGVIGMYDFVDTPNPTEMTVYLVRIDTGAKVVGDFRWAVAGV